MAIKSFLSTVLLCDFETPTGLLHIEVADSFPRRFQLAFRRVSAA
jgi:hypothetical protein